MYVKETLTGNATEVT